MTADQTARHLAVVAARAAADRKGEAIIALDVSERLPLTDIFVVVSGRNERQVSAIVDAVEEALHREGTKVKRREGARGARWVLLDFGDIVVHVQHVEDRMYYALERLWRDCPVVDLPADLYERAREEPTGGEAGLPAGAVVGGVADRSGGRPA